MHPLPIIFICDFNALLIAIIPLGAQCQHCYLRTKIDYGLDDKRGLRI